MTAQNKSSEKNGTTSRRERVVGWSEFAVDTVESFQKQWNDIAFGYADLALKAAKDGVAWMERFYEQSRKSTLTLVETGNDRTRAALERLG